jgi:hypothetical protein
MFIDQSVFQQDVAAQSIVAAATLAQITEIENRLAGIIGGAREMAAVAEEMMRNLASPNDQTTPMDRRILTARVTASKQLISATNHQLGALVAIIGQR